MITMHTRLLAAPALLLTSLFCSGGCAASGDDDPDPEEVIERAASTFAETQTARFTFDIEGVIPLDPSGMLALSSVEGEAERPANARASARVQFGGSTVTMELIAFEGEMWLRNVVTGQWERAPTDLQYDPAAVFDEDRGIAAILERLEDVEMVGAVSSGGEEAWNLSATVPTQAVMALTGDVFEAERLEVDLWIAQDDHRLLRVDLREMDVPEPLRWDIRLSDHGEPVDISPPVDF